MKEATKVKLAEALAMCDAEDRSDEFTLAYLQDYARVDFDCALKFMLKGRGFTEVVEP